MIPRVSRILIYPVKSLDSISVNQVQILRSGALAGDRTFALFDQSGNFVNAKRHPGIHKLRAQFDINQPILRLRVEETEKLFNLETDKEALCLWLTQYFGFPVEIKQNLDTGFPDDTLSPGPTIISTATLETVASWYTAIDVAEVRARFRANIEISGVPAFWEDRLFRETGKTVNFQIGDVQFLGVNPCQRCVVVTRDSQTGEVEQNFQKIFTTHRQNSLPDWVETERFNHFFRLAVNTRLAVTQAEKTISVGDQIIT